MLGYYAYANVMQKRYENEKGGKYVKFVFTESGECKLNCVKLQ